MKEMKTGKFVCGDPIYKLDDLFAQEFVMCRTGRGEYKCYNHGFVSSWQMQYAKGLLNHGLVFHAIKRDCRNPITYMIERCSLCKLQERCVDCMMSEPTTGKCAPLGKQTKSDIRKLQKWVNQN